MAKNKRIVKFAYLKNQNLKQKPKSRQLLIMSKDNAPYQTTGATFIVNRRQMAIVATDYDRNLRILHYDPKSAFHFWNAKRLKIHFKNILWNIN